MGVQSIADQPTARSEVPRVRTSDPQTKHSAQVTISHFMIDSSLRKIQTLCKKKAPNLNQILSLQVNGVPQASGFILI